MIKQMTSPMIDDAPSPPILNDLGFDDSEAAMFAVNDPTRILKVARTRAVVEVMGDLASDVQHPRGERDGQLNKRLAAQAGSRRCHEWGLPMSNQSAASIASRFRYRGHHQTGTLREFSFEDVQEKAPTHHFLLQVDTGLLVKHHVHLQDAPPLCLRLLSGIKLASSLAQDEEVRITISDDTLLRLIEEKEAAAPAKHKKKGR